MLNGLATIELERGHPTDAGQLYRRALVIKERVLGPGHPEIGVLLNNLAVTYRQTGQPGAASSATGELCRCSNVPWARTIRRLGFAAATSPPSLTPPARNDHDLRLHC